MFRAFRKQLLVVVVSLVACALAQAPPASIAGDYTGALGPLHSRLHIDAQQSPSGALTGTLDSVDQEAFGLECSQLVASGGQFSFAVSEVHGTYKGEISPDGNTITGTWNQGQPRALVFTRKTLATAASLAPKLAQIDTSTAAAFDKNPVGSVTVGVVSGPQLIWTKSYGNADMEKHVAADKDTVCRIGSITKMFTRGNARAARRCRQSTPV